MRTFQRTSLMGHCTCISAGLSMVHVTAQIMVSQAVETSARRIEK